MANGLDRIVEVTFKADGKEVHPRDVFSLLYSGLEPLIRLNHDTHESKVKSKRYSLAREADSENDERYQQRASAIKKEWKERSLPKLKAEVRYLNGDVVTYNVKSRTNFRTKALYKFPNIIHLEGNNGHQLVLRESRVYGIDNGMGSIVRSAFSPLKSGAGGDRLDTAWYNALISGNKQPISDVNGAKEKVRLIPEPLLLAVLEELYGKFAASEELTGAGIGRITPKIKVLDADTKNLWYLREHLPSMRDSHASLDAIGVHLGILHSLGLMDVVDRQLEHYVVGYDGRVVTFDPDFITHCLDVKGFLTHTEYRDAKLIFQDLPHYSGQVDFDTIAKARNKTIRLLEKAGITPESFLDSLGATTNDPRYEPHKVKLNYTPK